MTGLSIVGSIKVSRGGFILANRSQLLNILLYFLFFVFLLSGCGGGGGSSNNPGDDPNNDPTQNADISGQWRSTITAESGTVYQTYLNLTQDDINIGGSLHWDSVFTNVTSPSNDVSGAVDRSSVTLSVMVRNPANTDDYLEFVYKGIANDSEINGDVTITGEWDGTIIDDQGRFLLYRYIIEVPAEIKEPTTWGSRYVYIIPATLKKLYISNTLTIQPGTIIKSQAETTIHVREEGSIIAQGTSDERIVFTAYKDDDYCGDTNNDGATSAPNMGDWNGIIISGSQGSIFDYCHFLYSGVSGQNSALKLMDSQATISNCVFAHNGGGIYNSHYHGALDASDARLGTTISNNRFFDNILPLSINHNFDLDDTNTFQDASGTVFNTYNAVFYDTAFEHEIGRNLRWEETEVAIVIALHWCRLLDNTSLTLGDDVVLKFTSGCRFNLYDGETALNNHDGQGVFFSSFKDDALKGDSNGDGEATSPMENDWQGIFRGEYSNSPAITGWSNVLFAETSAP
jgi:hypothetical protein